mmetsp:Transcript_88684/g.225786  ORF Transcript_88684/g.225786 Transcript_88684/m.225786 type:complete len:83 (+) Transcript_88684:471-719(+)
MPRAEPPPPAVAAAGDPGDEDGGGGERQPRWAEDSRCASSCRVVSLAGAGSPWQVHSQRKSLSTSLSASANSEVQIRSYTEK